AATKVDTETCRSPQSERLQTAAVAEGEKRIAVFHNDLASWVHHELRNGRLRGDVIRISNEPTASDEHGIDIGVVDARPHSARSKSKVGGPSCSDLLLTKVPGAARLQEDGTHLGIDGVRYRPEYFDAFRI